MKHLITNLFVTTTSNAVAGLTLVFLGILILGHYELVIYNMEGIKVSNFSTLTQMDSWFGWLMVGLGIDTMFAGKILKWLTEKIISPVLTPIAESLVGKERLERLQARFKKKEDK